MEAPSFNPPAQWGERSKEISAGSCPHIGGAYKRVPESMVSKCSEKSCEMPIPQGIPGMEYTYIGRHPSTVPYKKQRIQLPDNRQNQQDVFWIDQTSDRQYAVVEPWKSNGINAEETIFQAVRGDFSCETGLIKIGRTEWGGSPSRDSSVFETDDIQIARMSDGALVYQVNRVETSRFIFGLFREAKREILFFRFIPLDSF